MDARFKAKIINALRRLTYTWSPRNQVKSSCKIDKALHRCMQCDIYCYEGKSEKSFLAYQQIYGVDKVIFERGHMDHIKPVIDPIKGWEGWDVLIEQRMYPEPNGWQHICSGCHKIKTLSENKHRTKVPRKKKNTMILKTIVLLIGLLACSPVYNPDAKLVTIELNNDNMVLLRDDVNDDSAEYVRTKLHELSDKDKKKDIYLVLDTNGGDKTSMETIVEACNTVPNTVHTISLNAISAGYFIVQLCQGKRYMTSAGYMMTHAWSHYPPHRRMTNYQLMESIRQEEYNFRYFYKKIADRINIPVHMYMKMIHQDYEINVYRAIEEYHADQVVAISCSNGMLEYEEYTMTLNSGTIYTVERSNCPTVNNIRNIKLIEGSPNYNDMLEINQRLKYR